MPSELNIVQIHNGSIFTDTYDQAQKLWFQLALSVKHVSQKWDRVMMKFIYLKSIADMTSTMSDLVMQQSK